MKKIYTFVLLVSSMLMLTGLSSCEFDTSPEPPDYPIYVTYIITAQRLSFEGPDVVMSDIEQWIKSNRVAYDVRMNYSTGDASEFSKQDADAIKSYQEFLPKFKSYLETELKNKISSGAFGEDVKSVKATYSVTATRQQGKDGNLKYEQVTFTYP